MAFMKQNCTIAILILNLLTLGLLPSCSKLTSNLNYDLSLQTASVDISIPPITDTSASSIIGTIVSVYNFDSFIKANTGNLLGVSNISSAKMVSCNLSLQNPDTVNNFADIQNATVIFLTNANTTPLNVATITNNPDTYASSLDLPVDATTDMSSYLHGNQLNYSINGKMRRHTTDTLICRVQLRLNVHVHR